MTYNPKFMIFKHGWLNWKLHAQFKPTISIEGLNKACAKFGVPKCPIGPPTPFLLTLASSIKIFIKMFSFLKSLPNLKYFFLAE